MGRNNKSYHKDLKQQIYEKLTTMLKNGEGRSKTADKKNNCTQNFIYSYNTYKSYWKHAKYFANYINEYHPECTTLKSAKKYVNEWLQFRVDNGSQNGKPLSAWTITLERQALGKLYGIEPDSPDFFKAPVRHREDIKRSRLSTERDKHFSETNNAEFIQFCKDTGCRRNIIEKLKGYDLVTRESLERVKTQIENNLFATDDMKKECVIINEALSTFPDQDYFIHHRTDKNGRSRFSPIIGDYKQAIIDRMKNTAPNENVWKVVPSNADIHGYRSDYATAIYKMYARPIEEIPYDKINKGTGRAYQSEVYVCRKDEVGKKLDKAAMEKASKALGHNRLEVVANNYIRGL